MTNVVNRKLFNPPESLPLVDIKTLVDQNTTVLIVAPHPDDETLGCGGVIALLHQLDIPVAVAIVSDGTKSHPNSKTYPSLALKRLREQESLTALKILGVNPEAVTFVAMPDGAVSNSCQSKQAIASIAQYLTNLNPAIMFLPWRKDPHPDHRASWQLFVNAIKNLAISPRLIEYPIWYWDSKQRQNFSESVNAWRLDISSVLELKRQAIAQYHSQISNLINDDPAGFRLSTEMLQNFTQPWEIYLEIN